MCSNMALPPRLLSMGVARTWLVWLTILTSSAASKLNVPRVLLPYSSSPPSFSLTSEAGCYSWSTTRPDIISLLPDNKQCSASAVSNTPSL